MTARMGGSFITMMALLVALGSVVSAQPQSASDYNATLVAATRKQGPYSISDILAQAQSSNNFGAFNQGLKLAYNSLDQQRIALGPNVTDPVLTFYGLLGQAFLSQPATFAAAAGNSTAGLSNYSIRADSTNPNSSVDIYARSLYAGLSQNGAAARPLLIALSSLPCNSVTLILNYALNDYPDAASLVAQFDPAVTSPIIQCFQQGGPDANPSFGSGIRFTGTFIEAFNRARARLSPSPSPAVGAYGRRLLF